MIRRAPSLTGGHATPVARRATLGWSGFLFTIVTVFLAVGAINSQNNLLFWVFGVAIAGVVVSGVVSGSGLMSLVIRADPVGHGVAGEPLSIGWEIANTGRRVPVFGLVVRELALGAAAPGACVLRVGAGSSARGELVWTPRARGVVELDRIQVESRFPFGLLSKTLEYRVARRVLIHPARVPLRGSVFGDASRGQDSGSSRRARRGAVGDYYGLRAYAPGDPRRLFAWRASARRGALLVLEHAETTGRAAWVWVTPPGDADDIVFERAIALALAAVRAFGSTNRPAGVWMPWAGIVIHPGQGRAFERRVADVLSSVGKDGPAERHGAPPVGPGEGLVVIELSPAGGIEPVDADRIDPRSPDAWLADGASLPGCLRRDRSGSGA